MPFQEYQTIIGTTAAVFTVLQFFSPMIVCRNVIKQGTTGNIEPTPFIGGFVMSILSLQQGIFMKDLPTIAVNSLALILNIGYISIFYQYSAKKEDLLSSVKKSLGFVLIVIAYAQVDSLISPKRAELISNSITTMMMFSLMGMPVWHAKSIMKNRSGDQIPFPMVASASCVVFLWLLYGISLENNFLIFQNSVGILLITFQLFLCICYSPIPDKLEKDKKKE